MYSTELGRLPVYGQFNFSDFGANSASAPFNNADYPAAFAPQPPVVDVQVIPAAVDNVPMPEFATTNLPPGSAQTFHCEPLAWNTQTLQQESTQNGGATMTFPAQSTLDTMPPLDSDTMTMWSAVPAGFE
jgi:hypothetical protein